MTNSISELSTEMRDQILTPTLTEDEPTRIQEQWNRTMVSYPTKCMHELLQEQVKRTPTAVAVAHNGEQITYQDMDIRANRLAQYMVTLGVKPETRVGVCVDRSIEMVVALLATLKAGAAYVPLDPNYPQERLKFMLEDSQARLLLTQSKIQASFAGAKIQRVTLDTSEQELAKCPASSPAVEMDPQNAAYVIYTSGSTGKPKGAVIRHSATATLLHWARDAYSDQELAGVLASTSICFDLSVFEIFVPLSWGGTVIMAKNALELPGLPEANRVTLINTAPAIMNELMRSKGVSSSVLTVNLAGEPLKRRLVEQIYREPNIERVVNLYGPTEDTTYSTYISLEQGGGREVPIGKPIAKTQAHVLDSELQPVAIGVAGDLYLSGDGLARGYLDRPDLTAERFIPNPFGFQPGERMYRTGDVARWSMDGNLEFLGRVDHQVKIRGMRIELGEIESTLLEHPRVVEATVTVYGDEADSRQLAVYYVANVGRCPEEKTARNIVADWQMVFNESYRRETTPEAGTSNFAGLNSSYTGQPIPRNELLEWTEATVERILALKPRKVLEIGCGTGLLLFRVAPVCEEYMGTDYSEEAIDYVRRQLDRLEHPLPQVRVERRCANDLAGIPGGYDLVVMNSVSQYFPSIEYFEEVIKNTAALLAPGGKIFVGDARNFAQLKPFRAAVAIQKAPDPMLLQELRGHVEEQCSLEEELVFDPAYFYSLPEKLPMVDSASVRLKRGKSRNELIEYRYDVVLKIGDNNEAEVAPNQSCVWLDWGRQELNLAKVREILLQSNPVALGIVSIPDARVWTGIQAWHCIKNYDDMTASQLRDLLASAPTKGVEPEDLWQLGTESGYSVEVYYDKSGASGCCCALFRQSGFEATPMVLPERIAERSPANTDGYVNNPVRTSVSRILATQLRRHVQKRLPEYMVPSYFIKLDEMPLTPNGKIDRSRLPTPAKHSSEEIIKPATATEEILAQIWEEVLAVDIVGLNSNFIDLGGHSLVAMRILARVRELFYVELPVQTLLESGTFADFAAAVIAVESTPGQTEKIADILKQVQSMSA